DDRRREVTQSLDIESIHDQAQAAQDEDTNLKCADFASIEDLGYIDRLCHYSCPTLLGKLGIYHFPLLFKLVFAHKSSAEHRGKIMGKTHSPPWSRRGGCAH